MHGRIQAGCWEENPGLGELSLGPASWTGSCLWFCSADDTLLLLKQPGLPFLAWWPSCLQGWVQHPGQKLIPTEGHLSAQFCSGCSTLLYSTLSCPSGCHVSISFEGFLMDVLPHSNAFMGLRSVYPQGTEAPCVEGIHLLPLPWCLHQ